MSSQRCNVGKYIRAIGYLRRSNGCSQCVKRYRRSVCSDAKLLWLASTGKGGRRTAEDDEDDDENEKELGGETNSLVGQGHCQCDQVGLPPNWLRLCKDDGSFDTFSCGEGACSCSNVNVPANFLQNCIFDGTFDTYFC